MMGVGVKIGKRYWFPAHRNQCWAASDNQLAPGRNHHSHGCCPSWARRLPPAPPRGQVVSPAGLPAPRCPLWCQRLLVGERL